MSENIVTDDRLVWVDVETTGLNPELDVLLEVGIVITQGPDLEIVAERDWIISTFAQGARDRIKRVRNDPNNFVNKMHSENGLWQDIDSQAWTHPGQEPRDFGYGPTQSMILDWLDNHDIRHGEMPLAGNSVAFDRAMLKAKMPKVAEHFHYRDINVSSVKELCRRFNPALFAKLDKWRESADSEHRALDDIKASVREQQFYNNNFLFLP